MSGEARSDRHTRREEEALQLFFHSDRSAVGRDQQKPIPVHVVARLTGLTKAQVRSLIGLTRAQIARGEGQRWTCIRGLCECDDG